MIIECRKLKTNVLVKKTYDHMVYVGQLNVDLDITNDGYFYNLYNSGYITVQFRPYIYKNLPYNTIELIIDKSDDWNFKQNIVNELINEHIIIDIGYNDRSKISSVDDMYIFIENYIKNFGFDKLANEIKDHPSLSHILNYICRRNLY